MTTQFITNDKGERIGDRLTDEYKFMIDGMLQEEVNGEAEYVSLDKIKTRFRIS